MIDDKPVYPIERIDLVFSFTKTPHSVRVILPVSHEFQGNAIRNCWDRAYKRPTEFTGVEFWVKDKDGNVSTHPIEVTW